MVKEKIEVSNAFKGLKVSDEDHPVEDVKKPKRNFISLLEEKMMKEDSGGKVPVTKNQARRNRKKELKGTPAKVEEKEKGRIMLCVDKGIEQITKVMGVGESRDTRSILALGEWHREDKGWYQVKSVVDSGSGAAVAPPDIAPFVPKQESPGSRRGQVFVSASKNEMANTGEKVCRGMSEEGRAIGTVYQIVEGVDRPLDSVSAICDKDNWVAFGKNGGFIESLATGERTFFEREDDVYIRSMWMKMPDSPVRPEGFARQGR